MDRSRLYSERWFHNWLWMRFQAQKLLPTPSAFRTFWQQVWWHWQNPNKLTLMRTFQGDEEFQDRNFFGREQLDHGHRGRVCQCRIQQSGFFNGQSFTTSPLPICPLHCYRLSRSQCWTDFLSGQSYFGLFSERILKQVTLCRDLCISCNPSMNWFWVPSSVIMPVFSFVNLMKSLVRFGNPFLWNI